MKARLGKLLERILFALILAYVTLMLFVYRRLYHVRIEGLERVPAKGPFIISGNELGQMGTTLFAFVITKLVLQRGMPMPMGFMDEFTMVGQFAAVFRKFGAWPVFPHGHGQGTAVLMESLKALRAGQILMINPEADMAWDIRPCHFTRATAWLALRTGAPVVFIVSTKGAYNIWPKWQKHPYLSGRFTMRVGQPLYLTDAPCAHVSDAAIDEANRQLLAEMVRLVYQD